MEYFVSQEPRSYSWIFDFGPEKLSGLWRNGPLARYGKLGNSHWENHNTKRIRNVAQMTFLAQRGLRSRI